MIVFLRILILFSPANTTSALLKLSIVFIDFFFDEPPSSSSFTPIVSPIHSATSGHVLLHLLFPLYFISSSIQKAIYLHLSLFICFLRCTSVCFLLCTQGYQNTLRYQPSFPSQPLLPSLHYLIFPSLSLYLHLSFPFNNYALPHPTDTTDTFKRLCHGA